MRLTFSLGGNHGTSVFAGSPTVAPYTCGAGTLPPPPGSGSRCQGPFSGAPTDTDLRGTFVWVRRDGRWRLLTNQLTPVTP